MICGIERDPSIAIKTLLRIGIGSITLFLGVLAWTLEEEQSSPPKAVINPTAADARVLNDWNAIPARMRNRQSPKPKRGFYGTREQGERLALVLMVEDLAEMRPKLRPLVLGSTPVPGHRLEGIYDDTRTSLFAAHILHPSTGINYVVFLGANRVRDYWEGRRFSWTGSSFQHSPGLLSNVLQAFGLISERDQLIQPVHFVGHSLGGSLAIIASARFGIPTEYTVFNSLGVRRTVLNQYQAEFSGNAVYSTTDVLRIWNGLNRLRVPGTVLRLPRAGLHKPFPMCRYLTYCREPVWRIEQKLRPEEWAKQVERQAFAPGSKTVDAIGEETGSKTVININD